MSEYEQGGIDPRLRLFRWDLNAMVRWERVRKCSIQQADPSSMTDFRTMVWAGMEAQVPGMTEDDVGSMITARNADAVKRLIGDHMNAGLPEVPGKNE